MKIAWVSRNSWNKKDMIYMYNEVLVMRKKEILSFVKTQVESESIMLNKISQADSDKTAYHLYVNMKKMNLLTMWRSGYQNMEEREKWRDVLFFFYICSEFCHTLEWNSRGFTCVPHPDPPSHLPLHPLPLGFPSAPGPSACLMHPTWAGDLFHPRFFKGINLHRVYKELLKI